ncbi:hypothetical protein BJ085DRAFT_32579 [Dimargaris cristalligena]|uniref:ATP-dependent rRNA helicase SPB4-like C-terminal extension domain-containing protein n=1 Tax=Dimargaris cristalligena TaxID=215637 RepID=A0A4P9ZKK3_9FUNG|nr:hypothetical protein BJ085DRAFT_32579 [Dimargaris cristalligena]|eukprot:RKP33588.1 hypothetical protein BJ085DRAFT_32579 [Dimargaris cristalligena]
MATLLHYLLPRLDLPQSVILLNDQLGPSARQTALEEFQAPTPQGMVLITTHTATQDPPLTAVDWGIQFEAPSDPVAFPRHLKGVDRSLLFLLPNELNFLEALKKPEAPLSEMCIYRTPKKGQSGDDLVSLASLSPKAASSAVVSALPDLQPRIDELINSSRVALNMAQTAYRTFILDYHGRTKKSIFNITNLDTVGLAQSLAFQKKPAPAPSAKAKTAKAKAPLKTPASKSVKADQAANQKKRQADKDVKHNNNKDETNDSNDTVGKKNKKHNKKRKTEGDSADSTK